MLRLRLRIAVLAALAAFYLLFTQKYRAYDIDNPWFLSFSYNAWHAGVQTDEFKRFRFPAGMDGVHLFGKVASYVQYLWMSRFGWSPQSIVELNTLFAIASLALLWSFLLRAGYREKWVAFFIVLLGIIEPFVSMVEKARFEYFAFFLLCFALWLAIQGWEFAALLIALLAVETEPAAIIVPVVVTLMLASRTKDRKKMAVKFALASLAAISVYLALHPGAVSEMVHAKPLPHSQPIGGTFRAYFIDRRRHLAELLVIMIGAGLYWKHRKGIADHTPAWMALVSSIALVLLHATPAYMVFGIPFLLWMVLQAFDREINWQWVPVGLLAFLLLGYGYLYKTNLHEGFWSRDIAALHQRIVETSLALNIPETQLHITGDYSLWFAHPDHYRAITDADSLRGADLYLCFDGPLEKSGLSALTSTWCGEAKTLVPMHELSTMNMRGHLLHILVPAGRLLNDSSSSMNRHSEHGGKL